MNQSILMTLTIAAAALMGGCSRGDTKPGAAGTPVLTATVICTRVPVRIDPPPVGHVMPYSTVTLRPQVGGVIRSVHFKEGQEVKKGDRLFTIDARSMEAALGAARAARARDTAQLENAEIQFRRAQNLLGQKLISQEEFDTSTAAREALRGTVAADAAAVANAELNLEYTEIRAPFDGRTGALLFHEGNVVKAPDDILLTLHQIHPIYVAFAVAERYLPEIQRQMREQSLTVTAAYENRDGALPRGTLTFVDNAVDMATGMIQLKGTFDNEDNALWPGQFVQVTLTLSERTNAMVVPSQAVQTGQSGQFIYVVKPDQTVEQRPVTLGSAEGDLIVVERGLLAGEQVVTDGQLRLSPGMKVNAKSGAAAPASAKGRMP